MQKHYKVHRAMIILMLPIFLLGLYTMYYSLEYIYVSRSGGINCMWDNLWALNGFCMNRDDYNEWGQLYEDEMRFYQKYWIFIKMEAELRKDYHIYLEDIPEGYLLP